MLAEDGRLVTVRIPTAFRESLTICGGKQEVTSTIGDTIFWIGDTALDHDGDALFIGPTYQRLVDPRMRRFLAAGLVVLLVAAGYTPGVYQLAVGSKCNPIRLPLGFNKRQRLTPARMCRIPFINRQFFAH